MSAVSFVGVAWFGNVATVPCRHCGRRAARFTLEAIAQASRAGRIQFWDEHSTDAGDTAQPTQLTPLGRCIAGLDPWPGPEREEGFRGLTADWSPARAARL